jgi:arabinoxylan arabinofuranohydrolase
MERRVKSQLRRVGASLLVFVATVCTADNPVISHVYTADPAARVFNGRMYVITSHDLDNQSAYDMVDYYMFSSDDMINWRDHGIVFDINRDTTWGNLAYAPDMIFRNGQYYLYFPDSANAIGVAVSSSPTGPFIDPRGTPLVSRSTPNANVQWLFDPGVFVDDDGQAYLYFGGGAPGNARVIRLNGDMISTNGAAISIDVPDFFEALYMHKRNGVYYLSYSTTPATGFRIDYLTSSNPTSGFTRRGTVLTNPWQNGNNNHHSILEFNGQWYVFYHNRAISNERGASSFQRSINVDRLFYNADGTIQQVANGPAGVPKLKNVDPFVINEAETIDNEQGIETEGPPTGTRNLAFIDNGDWVQVSNVDFGAGAGRFEARVASAANGGNIQIVLDNLANAPVGTLSVGNTGGWQNWQTVSGPISTVTGLHNVYLRFTGGSGALLNFDWWRFATGTGTPGGNALHVELESLSSQTGFSPFVAGSDAAASGGRFIEWPNNGANQILATPADTATGRVEIPFTLSQTANVRFDLQANMPNAADDSLYYKLDAGAWVTQNNAFGSGWLTYTPTTFNSLPAGSHTLRILRREDGARFDKVVLTASAGTIALGGGPSGSTSVTIQENTTGFCGVDGTIDSNQAGFTGAGFANTNNATGAAVRWRVNAGTSGSYTLQWRHANGTTTNRPGSVRVNGATVVSSVALPGTGAWTTWANSGTATVTLNAGANDVHLVGTTSGGLSNIDSVTVSGSGGISAAACN